MTSTLIGRALASDGVCQQRGPDGRWVFFTVDPTHLKRTQPRHLPIDIDHSGRPIGEIVGFALDHAGHLEVVAVVDEPPDVDRCYLSLVLDPSGVDLEVRGAALVSRPAAVGLTACRTYWGIDARRTDRGLPWGTPDGDAAMIAAACAGYRGRGPLHVAGLARLAAPPPASQPVESRDARPADDGWPRDANGRRIPIEYSAPTGRVIGVH